MRKATRTAHSHFTIISLWFGRPKIREKRIQIPGRNALATILRSCHCTISTDEPALTPKPVSAASIARPSMPHANIKWAKDRLSLRRTRRKSPPHRTALIKDRIELKVILKHRETPVVREERIVLRSCGQNTNRAAVLQCCRVAVTAARHNCKTETRKSQVASRKGLTTQRPASICVFSHLVSNSNFVIRNAQLPTLFSLHPTPYPPLPPRPFSH